MTVCFLLIRSTKKISFRDLSSALFLDSQITIPVLNKVGSTADTYTVECEIFPIIRDARLDADTTVRGNRYTDKP